MSHPHRPYEEYHFQKVEDVGVAFDTNRIWVCINGRSLLRGGVGFDGVLQVEFTPPEEAEDAPDQDHG